MRRPTRTELLGVAAVGLTATVIAKEYWGVWRRGDAPLPSETDDISRSASQAALQTIDVAVTGYKVSPVGENAALNLLLSYAITAGIVRLSTHTIRVRGSWGPFRNTSVSGRHIHHYIPGILLAFVAGGASVVTREESLDRWLAIPLGIGAALTMDEAALLVELEDVYWSEEGVLSVQATLGTMSLLGALALGIRAFHRGEPEVLGPAASR